VNIPYIREASKKEHVTEISVVRMTIANAAEMTESEVGLGRVSPIAKMRILENAETKHRFKKRYERQKNVSSFSVRPVIGRRIAAGFNS
jgi:hypothetical protein